MKPLVENGSYSTLKREPDREEQPLSFHPFPSRARALHQLHRHADAARRRSLTDRKPLTGALLVERWATAMRTVGPTAHQLVASWNAALKLHPASREEKIA
jgi:hypothetical protein